MYVFEGSRLQETRDVVIPTPEQLVRQVGFAIPGHDGSEDPYDFQETNKIDNLENYGKQIQRDARKALAERKEEPAEE